jgi:hypothetical protein
METNKTDQQGYSTVNPNEERDMGAKGGPTTTLGIPDNAHGISHPYDSDIQTQLAAKSTENKKDNTENKNLNEDWKTGQGDDSKIKSSVNNDMGE